MHSPNPSITVVFHAPKESFARERGVTKEDRVKECEASNGLVQSKWTMR